MTAPYEVPSTTDPADRLRTEAEAINWVTELLENVRLARMQCDVRIPGDDQTTVRMQRQAERTWLLRHGAALGSIAALYRVGLLGDVAYAQLRKQVMETMLPTTTGGVRG